MSNPKPSTIGGVRVYILTPDDIPPENKDKVLIHLHGGCYVLFPGNPARRRGSSWRETDITK